MPVLDEAMLDGSGVTAVSRLAGVSTNVLTVPHGRSWHTTKL